MACLNLSSASSALVAGVKPDALKHRLLTTAGRVLGTKMNRPEATTRPRNRTMSNALPACMAATLHDERHRYESRRQRQGVAKTLADADDECNSSARKH